MCENFILIFVQSTCLSELKNQTAEYPQFADFEGGDDGGSSAGDGVSTTDALGGADTPSAQPKIKLTFNSNRESAGTPIADAASDDDE